MISYANIKSWNFEACDQGLIYEYFPKHDTRNRELDLLPHAYNWNSYWDCDPGVVIVHWHGPKPERCIKCYIQHLEQSMADKVAMISCQCHAGYDLLWERAKLKDEGNMYLKLFHDYETHDLMTGNSASLFAAGEH